MSPKDAQHQKDSSESTLPTQGNPPSPCPPTTSKGGPSPAESPEPSPSNESLTAEGEPISKGMNCQGALTASTDPLGKLGDPHVLEDGATLRTIAWEWTQSTTRLDIFQDLAARDLIDTAAVPQQLLRAPSNGHALPLRGPTSLASSLEVELDDVPTLSTHAHSSAQHPSALGKPDDDLRCIGEGLRLDSEPPAQGPL